MKQKALTLMCKTVRAAAVAASTTIVAEELYAKMPTSDLFSLQSPGGHTTSGQLTFSVSLFLLLPLPDTTI